MDYSRYVNEIVVSTCSSVFLALLIGVVGFWRYLKNAPDTAPQSAVDLLANEIKLLKDKLEKQADDYETKLKAQEDNNAEIRADRAQLLGRIVELEKSDKEKAEKLVKVYERLDKTEAALEEEKKARIAAEAGKVIAEKNSAHWQGKFEGAIEIIHALPLIQAEIASAVEKKTETGEHDTVEMKAEAKPE